jgi:hypothetical protein
MRTVDDMLSLPEDPAALRALLLAARNEQLHHLLLKLKRRQFGQELKRLPR